MKSYRTVAVGQSLPNAVTLGIERDGEGKLKAAIWWESKGDVDADEAEFGDVAEALAAAEAARALHGFDEVVVVIADMTLWNPDWGHLKSEREPIGRLTETDLTSDEASALAEDIEAERDA